jgi:hypothetical protein
MENKTLSNQSINQPGYEIPDQTLIIVPHFDFMNKERIDNIFEPLTGKVSRDWFNTHFTYCLPLTIANQYGFIIKSERDFSILWDGNVSLDAMHIEYLDEQEYTDPGQSLLNHFGSGIFTVANRFHIRTPIGVNLMTIQPPNMPKDGIMHMSGSVESDNVQRDFTFNIKVTRPNEKIYFKKGDPIGAFIPIPRYFADGFTVKLASEIYPQEVIDNEIESYNEFGRQRNNEDRDKPHQSGRRYFKGIGAWGEKYKDHQLPRNRGKQCHS